MSGRSVLCAVPKQTFDAANVVIFHARSCKKSPQKVGHRDILRHESHIGCLGLIPSYHWIGFHGISAGNSPNLKAKTYGFLSMFP